MTYREGVPRGEVYGHYLDKLDMKETGEIEQLVAERKKLPFYRKLLSSFNPFEDWGAKLLAADDILESRKNSRGKTAHKTEVRLESC